MLLLYRSVLLFLLGALVLICSIDQRKGCVRVDIGWYLVALAQSEDRSALMKGETERKEKEAGPDDDYQRKNAIEIVPRRRKRT